MLHISSKIAHIEALKGNYEKAKQGFLWTLGHITNQLKMLPNDENLLELSGITKDWYKRVLFK